ncbi:MAG: lysylphosphatidylglycerol synthase transmembrane domain-containing protein [Nostocoides sp.]
MSVQQASAVPSRRPRFTAKALVQFGIGIVLALTLVIWGLPAVGQTTWSAMWAQMRQIPLSHAVGYQLLMLVGLYCYTFTFTGSLPGLRHGRALIVNLCGSSVSNLLPGGGAAGLAATVTILKSWGFTTSAVSASAIITGVWNVLARLALPLVSIIALYVGNTGLPSGVLKAGFVAAAVIAALLAAAVAFLASDRAARWLGRAIGRLLAPFRRRRHRRGRPVRDGEEVALAQRAEIIGVVRTGWIRLTLGMVGFFGIYFVLFALLSRDLGLTIPLGNLFAAYAVGRLLTAVGITPGGFGLTEAGTLAALVSYGADAGSAGAVVVLFSIFTQLMEIPLGALGWGLWALSPHSSANPAPPTGTSQTTPSAASEADAAPGPLPERTWRRSTS